MSEQIAALDQEITASIDALPDPRGAPVDTSAGIDGTLFGCELLIRLDEIPGVGPVAARALLAEIGPDMSVFPSPDHLASWAKLCPRTIQSGAKSTTGPIGKGNPWLKGALGEAASAAARTDAFLGARYRRLVKRRGHAKALVAVARSILVIAWHLISDPQARYHELGPDWHHKHLNPQRRTHDLVRQLERLGHTVTLAPNTA
ncbi:transposase [Streptomyces mirabilis]|uniref:transposase n=1 Tax=Streptomyces mirabilis TaxID=68239 RepID=UPI0033EC9B99